MKSISTMSRPMAINLMKNTTAQASEKNTTKSSPYLANFFSMMILFSSIGISHAQEVNQDSSRRFSFGLKWGMNISQLTGSSFKCFFLSQGDLVDLKVSQTSQTNIQIGGTIGYRMSKKFSLQGELLLVHEGGKSESEKYYYDVSPFGTYYNYVTFSFEFTKLTIPLQLKYHLGKKVSLETGPQAGLFLNATASCRDFFLVYFESYDCDLLHGSNDSLSGISNARGVAPIDLSFLLSMTYNVYKSIHLQARYVHGFSPININLNFRGSPRYSDFKSSVFQLSAEYKF